MNRTGFLQKIATAPIIAAATGARAEGAGEAAPRRHQAPGYYRLMLGDFEITAICDGTIDFPMDRILTNVKPGEADALFREVFLKVPIRTSVNQFLINTGPKLVLVDSGAGTLLGPALGQCIENMRAAGYQPQDVDEILLTHAHVDHAGGLASEGKRVFPNATVRVNARDLGALHPASLQPYLTVDLVSTFEGDATLMPGISAIGAYGHTPGHTFFRIQSKGRTLLLVGDAVHAAAVQFADPSVTVIWDSDAAQARLQRNRLFAVAARDRMLIGAAHIAFPGLGHVRSEGRGYAWVPMNYSASVWHAEKV